MPLIDIHHVAIKTDDVDATNRFYTEVLGMTLAERPPFGFPGSWLNMGRTMIHIFAGKAAVDGAGNFTPGGAAVDHIALLARDFDAMLARIVDAGLDWRQNRIPEAGLWQLFVHDPSNVLIELNFPVADEPEGAKGPDAGRVIRPGAF